MKKVAFYINPIEGWLGGVNYYKNLFLAISLQKNSHFEYFIFMPLRAKGFNFEASHLKNIIYDDNFLNNFSGTLSMYIKMYQIDILSHMGIFSDIFNCKIVNWIPDFQHKYLSDLFSKRELLQRDEKFEQYACYADIVVLSSNNAMNDFHTYCPKYKGKSRVLQFVSSIDIDALNNDLLVKDEAFGRNKKFFFLPNQFWQHKNHLVVFQAVAELKNQGIDITILCSGFMDDYRNSEHINMLKQFVQKHHLEENLIFLGVVSSNILYKLMWKSIAVINPSLFEGWSTTVEECKTMGKQMIVSNLDVHKEQNPKAIYFEPFDVIQLSQILNEMWSSTEKKDVFYSYMLKQNLLDRLIVFGQNYEAIVSEI